MSVHAIVDWNNFLPEVCADFLLNNPLVIGGPGQTVEKACFHVGKTMWVEFLSSSGYSAEVLDEYMLNSVSNQMANQQVYVLHQF